MRALLDLLLPPHCPGCGREGDILCPTCSAPLRRRLDEPAGTPVGLPATLPAGLLQLEWCAMYSGSVRAAIHAHKYGGERRLREPLGAALADRWRRAGRGGDLVAWVPVHPERQRERGFDQAEDLARVMAACLRLPVSACLERRQRTAAQHALGLEERSANMEGAFAVVREQRRWLHGRWVILVDDTMTTGVTLASCARALRACGAQVSAITLARDR